MAVPVAARSAAPAANPFPGLRPFRPDEEHLFFGRERQVDRMIDKLAATRFLAVVGTSGSGKSSLVNCGLRPALSRGLMAKAGTAWRMIQFRPGGQPIQAMARAAAADRVLFENYSEASLPLADLIEGSLRMGKLGLVDVCEQAHLPEHVNVLVVVDQFEELFRYRQTVTRARAEEGVAFVNLLLEAAAQREQRIYVVLTMRSDFLGDCAQLPGLAEAINDGQYLVPRLSRDERRAAIVGPVRVGGAEIESPLLTRLLNDVGDNPDQLSILQHALNRTWSRWQERGARGPLTLDDYTSIGSMAGALDQHADEAFEELGSDRLKNLCEKIFRALTDKGTDARGIRRPTLMGPLETGSALPDLCGLTGGSPQEVARVIDVFRHPSRSFLMPPVTEPVEPATVVDISHESLMRVWGKLGAWSEEEAQSARLYRRLAETAALWGKSKAGLWRDPDLQLALSWWERQMPSGSWAQLYGGGLESAKAFLDASRAHRDAEVREKQEARDRELAAARELAEAQTKVARQFRNWLAAAGVLLLVAVGASVFAYRSKVRADEALTALAEVQKLYAANTATPSAADPVARQVQPVAAGSEDGDVAVLPVQPAAGVGASAKALSVTLNSSGLTTVSAAPFNSRAAVVMPSSGTGHMAILISATAEGIPANASAEQLLGVCPGVHSTQSYVTVCIPLNRLPDAGSEVTVGRIQYGGDWIVSLSRTNSAMSARFTPASSAVKFYVKAKWDPANAQVHACMAEAFSSEITGRSLSKGEVEKKMQSGERTILRSSMDRALATAKRLTACGAKADVVTGY